MIIKYLLEPLTNLVNISCPHDSIPPCDWTEEAPRLSVPHTAWRGAFLLRLIALSYDRVSCVPSILIDTENTLKRVGVPVVNPIEADCETAGSYYLAVFK